MDKIYQTMFIFLDKVKYGNVSKIKSDLCIRND